MKKQWLNRNLLKLKTLFFLFLILAMPSIPIVFASPIEPAMVIIWMPMATVFVEDPKAKKLEQQIIDSKPALTDKLSDAEALKELKENGEIVEIPSFVVSALLELFQSPDGEGSSITIARLLAFFATNSENQVDAIALCQREMKSAIEKNSGSYHILDLSLIIFNNGLK